MATKRKNTKSRRKSQAAKSPPKKSSGKSSALDKKLLAIRAETGLTNIPSTAAGLKKISRAKKERVLKAYTEIKKSGFHYVKDVPTKTINKARKNKTTGIIPVGTHTVIVPDKSTWTNAKVKKGEPFKGQIIHTKPLGDGEMQLVLFPQSISSVTEFEKAARKNKSFQKLKGEKERFRYAFPSREHPGKLNFVQIEFASASEMAKHMLHYLPDDERENYDSEDERIWDLISVFRILGKNEMIEERLAEQEAERIERRRARDRAKYYKRKRKERGG